jgi:hypothetical protein
LLETGVSYVVQRERGGAEVRGGVAEHFTCDVEHRGCSARKCIAVPVAAHGPEFFLRDRALSDGRV